jgi:hypothetical protein
MTALLENLHNNGHINAVQENLSEYIKISDKI